MIMAASTAAMLAACSGGKDANRDTTAAGTTARDTAGMAGMSHDTSATARNSAGTSGAGGAGGAGGTSGSSGNAGGKQLTDAEIFSMVKQVNVGEVEAGKLAQTKATNGDVKSFASDMVSAHTKMLSQGMALGKTLGAKDKPAAEDSIAKGNMATASQLRGTPKGPGFDKAYIDAQVMGHQNALQLVQTAAGQAQNPDLKKMLTGAQPDIQKHLDRAKQIQSKLGQQ
jgi:putative membrane protein